MKLVLNHPLKIILKVPSGLEPDYETIGKLVDNMIIMCENEKKPLSDKAVGHTYSCEFVVGKKNKYKAELVITKALYNLVITHIKELTKYESTRSFAVTPKEKMMVKEAEKLAKEQLKEKEEKEKKEKSSKKNKEKETKTTTKKKATTKKKETVKKTTPKKKQVEEKWSDLD